MIAISQPLYKEIYEELKAEITNAKYKPGDRLPSEKELSDKYGISRITSRRVMELLANDGLISRQPGRGSFVEEKVSATPKPNNGHKDSKTLIGLVITDFSSSYGLDLISGIEKSAADNGCFIILRRSFGVQKQEQKAISDLVNLGVDGLLIFPSQAEHFSTEILKLVIDQFPLVLVDRHLRGVATTSVSSDNVAGARLAADYLLNLGHRYIGLVTPPPSDTTSLEDRVTGFVQAHAEKGVVFDQSLWINNITSTLPGRFQLENIQRDVETIKNYLTKNPKVSALFAVEHNIALLIKEAVWQLGKRIPEDISVICFDSPPTSIGDYEFTHVQQQQQRMGQLAVEALLKMANGEETSKRIVLDVKIVEGLSTTRRS